MSVPKRTLSKAYLTQEECTLDPEPPAKKPKTSESSESNEGCSSILQTGERKGQRCGHAVKQDGRCAHHFVAPRLTEPTPGRCACRTKKGEICGARLKPDQLYLCKRHETCVLDPVVIARLAAQTPIVIDDEPVEEKGFEEEPALVIEVMDVDDSPLPEPDIVPLETLPRVEELLVQDPQWKEHRVSEDELYSILEQATANDLTVDHLQYMEREIARCFT